MSIAEQITIPGNCECGQRVTLLENSIQPTMWRDRRRYIYTNEPDSGWCIFRCRQCYRVIDESFRTAAAIRAGRS